MKWELDSFDNTLKVLLSVWSAVIGQPDSSLLTKRCKGRMDLSVWATLNMENNEGPPKLPLKIATEKIIYVD